MTFRRPNRGDGRILLGVCAGLARRWDLEPRTVRVALGITLVPFGAGLLVYAALAIVMPADGATDRDIGRRGELGRSIAEALVVLAAALGIALTASASAGLAVFGLGSLALLLATAALAAVVLLDHSRTWLLGLVTLALALPAAAVELTDVSVARQAGELRAAITRPQDVEPGGYRAGLGPLLLDLRDFDAETGTITTIRARADLRSFVVALPNDRCFNLEVDYGLDRSWINTVAKASRRPTRYEPSAPGYPDRVRPDSDPGSGSDSDSGSGEPTLGHPTTLVAYGKAIENLAGRYRRPAPNPAAPTLRLELQTGRSQIFVRDYPRSIDPLAEPRWPTQAPPSLREIDLNLAKAQRSPSGGKLPGQVVDIDPKTGTISVKGRTAGRWVSAALSAYLARDRYPERQANRLAGACAARSELRSIRTRLTRQLTSEAGAYRGERAPELLRALTALPARLPGGRAQGGNG